MEKDLTKNNSEIGLSKQSKAKQSKAKQSLIIGQMDNTQDHTYESANRVYSIYALSPTISTNCGGDHLPKIIIKI